MNTWQDGERAIEMPMSAAQVTGDVPLYFGLMYWPLDEGDEVAVHSRSWDVISTLAGRLIASGITNFVIDTHPALPPVESLDLDTLPHEGDAASGEE